MQMLILGELNDNVFTTKCQVRYTKVTSIISESMYYHGTMVKSNNVGTGTRYANANGNAFAPLLVVRTNRAIERERAMCIEQ